MSDYQFQIYETARHDERDVEKKTKKSGAVKIDLNGLYEKPKATYKIFSRLFCNFAMPDPPGRPTPSDIKKIKTVGALDEYMKESRDEKKLAVETYIKKYLDSLPTDYKKNPETKKQIDINIERYLHYIVEKEYDAIDFEKFLSDDYQAMLKRNEEKDKNPAPKLTKEEAKAALRNEKDRKKEEEKALKDKLKAEEKALKDMQKAEEKEAKDKQKAEEKAKQREIEFTKRQLARQQADDAAKPQLVMTPEVNIETLINKNARKAFKIVLEQNKHF
jgi:hypothetical protein